MRGTWVGIVALATFGPAVRANAEPAWIKAHRDQQAAVSPSTRAVVLFTRTEWRLKPNDVLECHTQRIVRILKPDALEYSSYVFVLESGANLKQIEAWTMGPSGVQGHAGRAEAGETTLTLDGSYSDVRKVTLTAPNAHAGDVVAFECVHSEPMSFPVIGWLPQEDLAPVHRAELVVDAPPNWSIRLARAASTSLDSGSDAQGVVRETSPRHQEVTLGPITEKVIEPLCPPLRARVPRYFVSFVGPSGGSPSDSWKAAGAWYRGLTATPSARDQAPAELDARVKGDDAQGVSAELLNEVQHSVHYAAIELGAQRWVPDAASATWQRRYGDCKDKAALLVSALAKRGIDARLVIACTNDANLIDTSVVDLTGFNHVIAAVSLPDARGLEAATVRGPSGRPWVLCDPTTTLPLGYLPDLLAGTWGVIADPAEGLIRLPESPVQVVRVETRLRVTDEGSVEGNVSLHCEAQAAANVFAGLWDGAGKEDLRDRAQALLEGMSLKAEVVAVQPPVYDPARGVLDCSIRIRADNALGRSGRLRTLRPPFLFGLRSPPPAESRSLPLLLGARRDIEEHVELQLPAGWQCEEMQHVQWVEEEGEYQLTQLLGQGTVRLDRVFRQKRSSVPPESYERYRSWMNAAFRGDNAGLVLTTPVAH